MYSIVFKSGDCAGHFSNRILLLSFKYKKKPINMCIVIHIEIIVTRKVSFYSCPQVIIQDIKPLFFLNWCCSSLYKAHQRHDTYLSFDHFLYTPRGNTVQQTEFITSPNINLKSFPMTIWLSENITSNVQFVLCAHHFTWFTWFAT